jgi:hypothetical protein
MRPRADAPLKPACHRASVPFVTESPSDRIENRPKERMGAVAILDLYSNRRKRELGEGPDVFIYDQLPQPLRIQIAYILTDAIGQKYSRTGYATAAFNLYEGIVDSLLRHLGRLSLLEKHSRVDDPLESFILKEPGIEACLDAVELSLNLLERYSDYKYQGECHTRLTPAQAIADLNHRFMQHGVGYQYVSGAIIRTDSQYLHAEVVKPTLALLQDKRYKGANDEFLKAHEHYRKGEIKECLTNSLKAVESTLKTLCTIRGWSYQPTDTVKPLLDICFAKGLFPAYLQSHYSSLRSMLESGVPPLRNKLGGHGQGPEVIPVPPHYAAYALHMTGSAIQFLIEAEKDLPTIP